MKTIVITGSKGFFGTRFTERLSPHYRIVELNRTDLDLTNEQLTIEMLKHLKPDAVVHAAAQSDTGACQNDPQGSRTINVTGAVNVAKGCDACKAKMIFLSSDQVYNGNLEPGPYQEDAPPLPNTVYGSQKLEAEQQVSQWVQDPVSLRLTWLFSLPEPWKKTNGNLVWNIAKSAMQNTPLTLSTQEYRGMTYVYDLIQSFHLLLDLPGGVYNIGNENTQSTYDTALWILDEMGLRDRSETLLIPDTNRPPRDLRMDTSKLASLGVSFESTQSAIQQCLRDFSYFF